MQYEFWPLLRKSLVAHRIVKRENCVKSVHSYTREIPDLLYQPVFMALSAGVEKIGKTGSSLPGNFVIWREKIKKYIREIIPHWREICPAGGKFCPACRELNIFSKPDCQPWAQIEGLWGFADHTRKNKCKTNALTMFVHRAVFYACLSSCSHSTRFRRHTHLTNRGYFDYGKNPKTPNWAPCWNQDGAGSGISRVYLW